MMDKLLCLALLGASFPVATATKLSRQIAPLQVSTSSGVVQGHNAAWPPNSTVSEFLGIPYGQAPVGDLRFAAPLPFSNTPDEVFVADQFGQDCVQYNRSFGDLNTASPRLQAFLEAMGGASLESPHQDGEDCLSVNVWTKQTSVQNKAVLMWIYGGGYSIGQSNASFYSGARLAQDEDVVVVSFNYRLNIFGFPNAPGLEDQNAGLLDQRLAVEWVRNNIAGFGGDPARITLFGESAGATSVEYYSYAWTADPIVNGFIAQSGSVSGRATPPVNNAAWYNVSSALGCGGPEAGNQTVPCMRGKAADEIIAVVGRLSGGGLSQGFGPAADGKVVFSDNPTRSAAGNFIPRPLLTGTNDFEGGFVRGFGSSPINFLGVTINSTDEQVQNASEMALGCGAAVSARDRVANGVPAWRYRYMPVWENVALAPRMGAYHTSEIPIVFGTNSLRPNSTADVPEEVALSAEMVHAWAEFAKDPDNGLTGLTWPVYDPAGNTLIRLGFNNQSALNFAPSTQYDSLCTA